MSEQEKPNDPKDGKAAELGARGGKARAERLSPERRSEIASSAAQRRWGLTHKETHGGTLNIAGREIACAVLDNGKRVLSTSGVSRAFGSKKVGVNRPTDDGLPQLPPFLAAQNVAPFISAELRALLNSPIPYKPKGRTPRAVGYDATLLPMMCGVIIDADRAGALRSTQNYLVDTAHLLLRGFATVGIIALVDEATGYQADRDHAELQRILEAYIAPELMPWTDKFPPTFFKELFRIYGWQYRSDMRGPRYAGKLINKFVYERLPPGVLDGLRAKNPPGADGRRKHKHYAFLTAHTGNPHLDQHLQQLMAVMRAAESKGQFERMVERAFPLPGDQIPLLPAAEPEPEDSSEK